MKKHRTKIQVRFADCDMLQHVNNALYPTYMEIARVKYVNEVVEPFKSWDKTGIMLAAYTMDFKIPVYLNDRLFVDTCVTRIGNKSFTMEYDFVVETDTGEVIKAHGTTVLVYYHYKDLVSLPVPEFWKEQVNKFQGSSF